MSGKARVTIDAGAVQRLEAESAKALAAAADATLTDILAAQVIPFDYGTMQNNQTFVDDSVVKQGHAAIVTSAKQATRLYFHPEYNFQTVNNPNAKAGWFDDWVTGAKSDFAQRAFAKFLKQRTGGV